MERNIDVSITKKRKDGLGAVATTAFNLPIELSDFDENVFAEELTVQQNLDNYVYTIGQGSLPFVYTDRQENIIEDVKLINYLVDVIGTTVDTYVLTRLVNKTYTEEDIKLLAGKLGLEGVVGKSLKQKDLGKAMEEIIKSLTKEYLR